MYNSLWRVFSHVEWGRAGCVRVVCVIIMLEFIPSCPAVVHGIQHHVQGQSFWNCGLWATWWPAHPPLLPFGSKLEPSWHNWRPLPGWDPNHTGPGMASRGPGMPLEVTSGPIPVLWIQLLVVSEAFLRPVSSHAGNAREGREGESQLQ